LLQGGRQRGAGLTLDRGGRAQDWLKLGGVLGVGAQALLDARASLEPLKSRIN